MDTGTTEFSQMKISGSNNSRISNNNKTANCESNMTSLTFKDWKAKKEQEQQKQDQSAHNASKAYKKNSNGNNRDLRTPQRGPLPPANRYDELDLTDFNYIPFNNNAFPIPPPIQMQRGPVDVKSVDVPGCVGAVVGESGQSNALKGFSDVTNYNSNNFNKYINDFNVNNYNSSNFGTPPNRPKKLQTPQSLNRVECDNNNTQGNNKDPAELLQESANHANKTPPEIAAATPSVTATLSLNSIPTIQTATRSKILPTDSLTIYALAPESKKNPTSNANTKQQQQNRWLPKPIRPCELKIGRDFTKDEMKALWRQYRQDMKPFKNKEFRNAKRVVQRLGKKTPEELDEKERERLAKAREFVEGHKAILSQRSAQRYQRQALPVIKKSQEDGPNNSITSTTWKEKPVARTNVSAPVLAATNAPSRANYNISASPPWGVDYQEYSNFAAGGIVTDFNKA